MLRLRSFSGDQTHASFLPLMIVLLYDLEKNGSIPNRSARSSNVPVWGELMLLECFSSAAIMVFRSDNVQFVPDFEVRLRDALERASWSPVQEQGAFRRLSRAFPVQPVHEGPALAAVPGILRLAVTLAFSSVVNSFCHFLTRCRSSFSGSSTAGGPASLMGVAILFLCRLVVIPLWARFRGALMRCCVTQLEVVL